MLFKCMERWRLLLSSINAWNYITNSTIYCENVVGLESSGFDSQPVPDFLAALLNFPNNINRDSRFKFMIYFQTSKSKISENVHHNLKNPIMRN